MKILRISNYGYVAGGTENGIMLLQSVLERMGHTVKVLTSDAGPTKERFNHYTFPSQSGRGLLAKLLYRAFYPHSYFALRRVLKEFNPDIVQLHTMSEASASVLFALRDYPTVHTVHGSEDFTPSLLLWSFPPNFFKGEAFERKNLNVSGWLHYAYHRYISGMLFMLGFRNVQKFIVFSAYMQKLLRGDGIDATLIPNATRLFIPKPIDTTSRIIAFVGSLEKVKGVQDCIQALPALLTRYPDAQLHIAGEGTYRADLQALASRLGVSSAVMFLGRKNREELYELYGQASVVVMPSIWPEPFGKVGIEAMSVGRPVIATDVGGISEWLSDQKTGYLVPPGNAKAIAEKVELLWSDPSRMQSMSVQAVENAKNFSIEVHAQKIVSLYQGVIDAFKARSK